MFKTKQFNDLNILITQKKDGNFRPADTVVNFLNQQKINRQVQRLFLDNGAKRIFSHNFDQTDHHADAIIADLKQNPDVCLSFVTGDCFPLVTYDPKRGILALIHAGWMPLVQNIIELTISDMKMTFNSQPSDMQFWIGPGIHHCCYKTAQLPSQTGMPEWDKVISQSGDPEWTIDLNKFIKNELTRLGANPDQIVDISQCTGCSRNESGDLEYFSYKNSPEDERKKRFITAVWKD